MCEETTLGAGGVEGRRLGSLWFSSCPSGAPHVTSRVLCREGTDTSTPSCRNHLAPGPMLGCR